MKQLRILFLCKRFYTNKDLLDDRFGRMYHLPTELANRGHKVLVIALDYLNTESKALKTSNAHFRSIPSNSGGLNLFSSKHLNAIHAFSPDLIIGSANSNIGFIAYALSHKLHLPFVFDLYDYYPAFPGKFKSLNRILFNFCTKHADLISIVSEPLQQKISNKNTIILENGVDLDLFKFRPRSEIRNQLKLPQDIKIIGYFGSIESRSGLNFLIEAARIVQKQFPSLSLLIAGRSDGSIPLQSPLIDYRGHLSQTQIAQYISASDLVVIPYPHQAQNDYTNSCKIAEYLACQVPIVSTDVSDYKRHFSNPHKIFTSPDNPQDFAAKIIAQLEDPFLSPFPQELSWKSLAIKFETSLQTLIGSFK